jgi:hypothetical protein
MYPFLMPDTSDSLSIQLVLFVFAPPAAAAAAVAETACGRVGFALKVAVV